MQSAASEDRNHCAKTQPHSFRNTFEHFAHSSLAIEPDDEDEDEQDAVWDKHQATAGTLSPSLKYQRTSAKWRPSNDTDGYIILNAPDIAPNLLASYTDFADRSPRPAAPMESHTSQMMTTA